MGYHVSGADTKTQQLLGSGRLATSYGTTGLPHSAIAHSLDSSRTAANAASSTPVSLLYWRHFRGLYEDSETQST